MGAAERPGTIDPVYLFGYDSQRATAPQASAAASGIPGTSLAPALWFVGLILILVGIRSVWEVAA